MGAAGDARPLEGRLHEIDPLVLTRTDICLVEISSSPGVLTGDPRDWTSTEPGGRPHHRDCPYPVTNRKAKVLASLLNRRWKNHPGRPPFVQPLVFLSHESIQIRPANGRPQSLLTKADVRDALVNGIGDRRAPSLNCAPS